MLGNQYFGDSFRGNLLLLDVRVRLPRKSAVFAVLSFCNILMNLVLFFAFSRNKTGQKQHTVVNVYI